MKLLVRFAIPALLLMVVDVFATAQKPQVANAKVQEVSGASGLKATIDEIVARQEAPLWIGYRIPSKAKERMMCCVDSWGSSGSGSGCVKGCRIDASHGVTMSSSDSACSGPEPLPYAFVFLRTGDKGDNQIRKIRVYSADCQLDFAGLPLFWIDDVKPEQSVELLAGFAVAASTESDREGNEPVHGAVMAIALHDSPAADAALERLIQPGQPVSLRGNVAFWLGVERGKRGVELLRKYIKADPSDRVREKGTFAFSQSKEPDAVQDLIDMARHDPSPRVRGQAIFWMAQVGGRKEAEQITAAIENDPETEVKKKAVFALSQMHGGEGVPLLIQLAKTNKNPAVRKQAIFWLGQSHDPRALDFLEEIITK